MPDTVTALPPPAGLLPAGVPAPRVEPRPEHLAHPDSPVGRTRRAMARRGPLGVLEDRIGRPLLDLGQLTDHELHAVTDLLLAEKHRRAVRWLALDSELDAGLDATG